MATWVVDDDVVVTSHIAQAGPQTLYVTNDSLRLLVPLFPQCRDYKHAPPGTVSGSAGDGAQSFGYLGQQTVRASAEEMTGSEVAEEQIFIYFIFILCF